MRFQTEYTCGLMNEARHAAFGKEAAKHVLASLGTEWPHVCLTAYILCFKLTNVSRLVFIVVAHSVLVSYSRGLGKMGDRILKNLCGPVTSRGYLGLC